MPNDISPTRDTGEWSSAKHAAIAARSELIAEWAYPGDRHPFTWRLYREHDGTPHIASDTAETGDYSFFRSGGTIHAAMRICERSAKRHHAQRIR